MLRYNLNIPQNNLNNPLADVLALLTPSWEVLYASPISGPHFTDGYTEAISLKYLAKRYNHSVS